MARKTKQVEIVPQYDREYSTLPHKARSVAVDKVKDYLAQIGSKGGRSGVGKSKIRGDADYYKRISAKAAKARKAKRATAARGPSHLRGSDD